MRRSTQIVIGAMLFAFISCASAPTSADVRIVVFSKLEQECRISICVDNRTVYSGIAASVTEIQPSITFALQQLLTPGQHHIVIIAEGRSEEHELSAHGRTNLRVFIDETGIKVVVSYGEEVYI